jgi:hypothetical protein
LRLEEFEHVLGAAAEAIGQDDFVVIGSQAILGSFAQPPDELLSSLEADIYPLHDPERAAAIDGALGDGSQFQLAYGYYAHGVGPETAKAPSGWQERLVRRDIRRRVAGRRDPVAWCLEVHDLVLSKCVAGRERDWDYAAEALKAELAQPEILLARIHDLPVTQEIREQINGMLNGILTAIRLSGA